MQLRNTIRFIDANLYWILCTGLWIILFYYRDYGRYDFWEHAATIKAMQKSYFSPDHPYLKLTGISHHFFSPYHLMAAWLANNLHVSNLQILIILGFFNLAMLFVVFHFFIKKNFSAYDYWKYIPFYGLLLIILLWGRNPWLWSGFYHLKFIKEQIYLPSAFAFNLFLVNGIFLKEYLTKHKPYYLLLILMLQWLIVLIHPNTSISAIIFYLALATSHSKSLWGKDVWLISGISACAFLLTMLWPFYSFFDLLTQSDVSSYNDDSYKLYQNFWADRMASIAYNTFSSS